MTLLLDDIDVLATSGDPGAVDITGVEHDSRCAGPGTLFCALPGRTSDGHVHAREAVERGAVAVVCERALPDALPADVVVVRVAPGQSRPAMARLAAAYWSHPAERLTMVGVTGTNGKTTVTHLVGAVAAHVGRPTTVLGTLSGVRTTPESTELQRELAAIRDRAPAGSRPVVAMEVSSHALDQHRVDAIAYDVAAFTNLSHDHLDFHGTMDAYFAAKARLFEPERARLAVVDVDGEWGARLFGSLRIPAVAVRADQATEVRLGARRSSFRWRGETVTVAMTGLVNVRNALMAAEIGVALGIEPGDVAAGLGTAAPVPGRLAAVAMPPGAPDICVLVDYAHTPAALDVALGEARRLARQPDGRVLVVFGCGGARDRAKRPLMGEVAVRTADVTVVTSDNPRDEDPARIADEIVAGVVPSPAQVQSSGRLLVELDRRRAIWTAVGLARAGDVVVVAGKGHERYQELAGGKVAFDDAVVAGEAVAALVAGGSGPSTEAG
jgi:UDP-N-acetylmuramoyl-L-alanyl-D-glutamate--2,6-diaminopimelate ligase